jgi:tellurite resistance protein TerC
MLLTDIWKVPIWLSLLVIAALIGGSVLISLRRAPAVAPHDPEHENIESV